MEKIILFLILYPFVFVIGQDNDLVYLDPTATGFEKVIFVPEKLEFVFAYRCTHKRGEYREDDIGIIVTDTLFKERARFQFGDTSRREFIIDFIRDFKGNFIVLSRKGTNYPSEIIPKPTTLTVLSPDLKITSQLELTGEGFKVVESKNGYYVFCHEERDHPTPDSEAKVSMISVEGNKEKWRKHISKNDAVFRNFDIKVYRNKFAYLNTREAYSTQLSPNDRVSGFNHALALFDSSGKVSKEIPLSNLSLQLVINAWHIKGDELYILAKDFFGIYTTNLEQVYKSYFIRYNLTTGKQINELLGESSRQEGGHMHLKEIFEINGKIMAWYSREYNGRNIGLLSEWGNTSPVKKEEWKFEGGNSLYLFPSKNKLILIIIRNVRIGKNGLFVKYW